MHTAKLRKVGVGMKNGRTVVAHPVKRYTLAELLAACDPAARFPPDDGDDWTRDAAVGRELI